VKRLLRRPFSTRAFGDDVSRWRPEKENEKKSREENDGRSSLLTQRDFAPPPRVIVRRAA